MREEVDKTVSLITELEVHTLVGQTVEVTESTFEDKAMTEGKIKHWIDQENATDQKVKHKVADLSLKISLEADQLAPTELGRCPKERQ